MGCDADRMESDFLPGMSKHMCVVRSVNGCRIRCYSVNSALVHKKIPFNSSCCLICKGEDDSSVP